MKSFLRKLGKLFDGMAFANAGNFGEFKRLLHRAPPGAACGAARRAPPAPDPAFARWLASLGGGAASAEARIQTLERENGRLRRLLAETLLDGDTARRGQASRLG